MPLPVLVLVPAKNIPLKFLGVWWVIREVVWLWVRPVQLGLMAYRSLVRPPTFLTIPGRRQLTPMPIRRSAKLSTLWLLLHPSYMLRLAIILAGLRPCRVRYERNMRVWPSPQVLL